MHFSFPYSYLLLWSYNYSNLQNKIFLKYLNFCQCEKTLIWSVWKNFATDYPDVTSVLSCVLNLIFPRPVNTSTQLHVVIGILYWYHLKPTEKWLREGPCRDHTETSPLRDVNDSDVHCSHFPQEILQSIQRMTWELNKHTWVSCPKKGLPQNVIIPCSP